MLDFWTKNDMLDIGDEIFTKWRRRWVLWYLVFLL